MYSTSYDSATVEVKSTHIQLARSFWPGPAYCRKWTFQNDKEDLSTELNSKGNQKYDIQDSGHDEGHESNQEDMAASAPSQ